jgi:AraC-like DNA-binding protein
MARLKAGTDLVAYPSKMKEALVEKIKNALIEMVHHSEESPKLKISHYLSEKLNYDYTYLANVFSEKTNTSIRQFIISHKIERVKELLLHENLTLSEIAYKLNYSSVAYLSNQFKKNAGQMPSHFKKMKAQKLIARELVLKNKLQR